MDLSKILSRPPALGLVLLLGFVGVVLFESTSASGLKGEYFSDSEFKTPLFTRLDDEIFFHYPAAPILDAPVEPLAVRWTGLLETKESGHYEFGVRSEDVFRLWINGELLTENKKEAPPLLYSKGIELARGKHELKIEFSSVRKPYSIRLFWVPPGGRAEVVPSRVLEPDSRETPTWRSRAHWWDLLLMPAILIVLILLFDRSFSSSTPRPKATFSTLVGVVLVSSIVITRDDRGWLSSPQLGNVFDALGAKITQGRVDLESSVIRWESFTGVDGKLYTYFGPFPALIRLACNSVLPSMEGLWTRLFCGISHLLLVVGAFKLFNYCEFASGRTRLREHSLGITPLAVACVGLSGAPLIIVAAPNIYAEVFSWAMCLAVWSIYMAFKIVDERAFSWRTRFGFSLATGALLLTRLTMALPFVAIVAALGLRDVLRARKGAPSTRLPMTATAMRSFIWMYPAIFAGGLQLAYNRLRFGSPFTFVPMEQSSFFVQNPKFVPQLFDVTRVPYNIGYYFGDLRRALRGGFPLRAPSYALTENLSAGSYGSEFIFSLTTTCPWLYLAVGAGLLVVFRRQTSIILKAFWLLFIVQCLIILSFWYPAGRYVAEFLPFIVFSLALALRNGFFAGPSKRKLVTLFWVVGILSMYCTLGSMLNLKVNL